MILKDTAEFVCMYVCAAYAYLSAFSLSVSAFRSNCIPLSLPVWRRRWRIRNVIVWAQQKIKHTQRVSLVVAVDDVKFSALGRYTYIESYATKMRSCLLNKYHVASLDSQKKRDPSYFRKRACVFWALLFILIRTENKWQHKKCVWWQL